MELPGKSLIKGHHTGGEMDGRAVSAMWDAVGGVGEKVQGIGEMGMKVAKSRKEERAGISKAKAVTTAASLVDKESQETRRARVADQILEVTERTKAAEASREVSDRISSYQAMIAPDADITEDQAEEGWYKYSKDLTEKYGGDGSSPDAARSRSLIMQGAAVARQTVGVARLQRVKQSAIRTIDLAEKSGDVGQLEQGLSVLKHFTSEEEYKVEYQQSYRRMQTHQVENTIGRNPLVMHDELAKPDFLKNHPHLTEEDLPRLRAKASGAVRQSEGEAIFAFHNELVTDGVKTKEDIERRYTGKVSPYVMEQMKGQFTQFHAGKEIERRMSPEYQTELQRKVGDEIANLRKPGEYGMSYANASFGLSQMTDSPMKAFYTEKLQAAKEGRAARTHDAKLSGFEQIERLTRTGVFHAGGTDDGSMEMSRQRAIHDGFLGDTEKLSTWFSQEQAEEIRNAGGNTAREHAFKRIWAGRANQDARAGDPFVQATADAILNGDEKITYSTPESLQRAALRQTEARDIEAGLKDRLNDFLLVNPDVSHQRINEEISRNVQDIGARILASNKRTALPSWKSDAPALGIYER